MSCVKTAEPIEVEFVTLGGVVRVLLGDVDVPRGGALLACLVD